MRLRGERGTMREWSAEGGPGPPSPPGVILGPRCLLLTISQPQLRELRLYWDHLGESLPGLANWGPAPAPFLWGCPQTILFHVEEQFPLMEAPGALGVRLVL